LECFSAFYAPLQFSWENQDLQQLVPQPNAIQVAVITYVIVQYVVETVWHASLRGVAVGQKLKMGGRENK